MLWSMADVVQAGRFIDEIADPEQRRGELAAPPGGETDVAVLERVHGALSRLDATNPPGPVLVVSHHGVVRLLSKGAGVPITESVMPRSRTKLRSILSSLIGRVVRYASDE